MSDHVDGAVFLVGCRAVGKTSVGEHLAALLGRRFVDTDHLVTERIGTSIAAYFASHGEGAFRDRESECLASLVEGVASGDCPVVATGGGIILRTANVKRMRDSGVVVWLRSTPTTIRARLERDAATLASRPALTGTSATDEVEAVLEARAPLYEAAAHGSLDTDDGRSPAEIAAELANWLKRRDGDAERSR